MGFITPSSYLGIGRRRVDGAAIIARAIIPSAFMMLDPHHITSFFDAHSVFSSTPPLLASSATTVETASSAFSQALQIISGSATPSPSLLFPFLTDQTAAAAAVADTAAAEHLKVLMEEESLNSLGHDFLIFLAAAVVAEPLGKILNVTPVLLYLLFGAVAGPYGLSVFTSGTEVNSEIGDYGILFLLFVEGLNLSPERLKALGSFFSLGATQLLLSVALIFFGLFFGGPFLLPFFQDVRVPIDPTIVTDLFQGPVVAFCIAAAGALSSSAFVLPILKEKVRERKGCVCCGLLYRARVEFCVFFVSFLADPIVVFVVVTRKGLGKGRRRHCRVEYLVVARLGRGTTAGHHSSHCGRKSRGYDDVGSGPLGLAHW
jgi:Sodium/hydrogen exchanger family